MSHDLDNVPAKSYVFALTTHSSKLLLNQQRSLIKLPVLRTKFPNTFCYHDWKTWVNRLFWFVSSNNSVSRWTAFLRERTSNCACIRLWRAPLFMRVFLPFCVEPTLLTEWTLKKTSMHYSVKWPNSALYGRHFYWSHFYWRHFYWRHFYWRHFYWSQ